MNNHPFDRTNKEGYTMQHILVSDNKKLKGEPMKKYLDGLGFVSDLILLTILVVPFCFLILINVMLYGPAIIY